MENNPELQLAWQFIGNTGTHLFLTGKAGTGKTTFLKQLKAQSPKRMVVVAPTGIAAINAGGVTIHSFFQLPFAPFVPDTTFNSAQTFHKFGKEKINIIRSMDLLVIDEISMVRADLLDAIDAVLRRYRDRYKAFGGVQLLMIGDLQQLAPIIRDDDWKLLSPYYGTAFFFGSRVLRDTEYVTIELKQVYRQSDGAFLRLLNKIRNKQVDDKVLRELNKRYLPEFRPKDEDGYIRLTTHNYQAQQYNDHQLAALSQQAYSFKATVDGVFPESAYPADEVLTVKRGAQIMFIKNDSSSDKRFYNGKIGLVTNVSKEGIKVRGNDDSQEFLLETEEWSNSKYSLNRQTKEITEEVEGTFRQYPIRLAWAITIHKSQGLTFERAIIDANSSFAHGQVYVALSRCKTLEGLVLSSPLSREAIINDNAIDKFTREAEAQTPDQEKLQMLQRQYFYELLCEQFNFYLIEQPFSQLLRLLDEHLYRLYPKLLARYKEADELYKAKISKVADTFQLQYSTLVSVSDNYATDEQLHTRIVSGANYFGTQIDQFLSPLIQETKVETDNRELKKKLIDVLDTLKENIRIKRGTLHYTAQEGFTVTSYLKHKAVLTIASDVKADKSERKRSSASAEKIEVSTDVLHPALYQQIIAWRNALASKGGVAVYTIIQQKAVLGIVNLLPADAACLLRIPYCGKKLVENHGDILLEMVNQYVEKNRIQRPDIPEVVGEKNKQVKDKESNLSETPVLLKQDTKEVSYELFKQGKSLEQISQERELVTGTIAGHLATYVRSGEIKIESLVSREKIDKIVRYLKKHGNAQGLAMMKAALGDDVSYGDIKLVMASFLTS